MTIRNVEKTKPEVFISHITEESSAANKLKSFLKQTFGKELSIFVSSDYTSITSGELWYQKIIESLKSAKIVIVLVSKHSVERRWINFEAGIGSGSSALVIPVVFRDFGKSNVGLPLSMLQIRSLQ